MKTKRASLFLATRRPASFAASFLALCAGCTAVASPGPANVQLAEAARNDDSAVVVGLLKQKSDVNATLADGTTALHWAVYNDDLKLVQLLLRAGANPRAAARVGAITPLDLACTNGDSAVISALLKAGADPNATATGGETPLMIAAGSGSVTAVNALLDGGADINARDTVHGQTALMYAASKDRATVIRVLIKRGADIKVTSTVVKLSRAQFDEDGNPLGGSPGGAGGSRGGRRNQGVGLAAPDPGTASPFDDPTDPLFGGFGPAPTRPTPDPTVSARAPTPARAGGRGGAGGAFAAAAARRASALVLGGNTALLLAAREGHISAVRALVESGADVNEQAAGDKTPPIVIAICNGHYDVARYLLDHGADPNLASADGLAALYAVIDTQWAPMGWAPNPITEQENNSYLDLMKALLEHKADPNTRLIKKLWFRPTHHDETWIGTAGATAFWRAAQATDLSAMKLLAAAGADVKIASNEGVNALMVASGLGYNGNFSTQGPYTALDCVKYCLELGLDPTPADVQGYTALAGAAYRGDNQLVSLLASKGAKLDARTDRGWSVTDMANGPSLRSSVPVKHPETVALLLKLGAPELTPIVGEEILGIKRQRPVQSGQNPATGPVGVTLPTVQQISRPSAAAPPKVP